MTGRSPLTLPEITREGRAQYKLGLARALKLLAEQSAKCRPTCRAALEAVAEAIRKEKET